MLLHSWLKKLIDCIKRGAEMQDLKMADRFVGTGVQGMKK